MLVRNALTTESGTEKITVVTADGAGISALLLVRILSSGLATLASSDLPSTMPARGFAPVAIAPSAVGVIRTRGEFEDAGFSFTPGATLYVGTAGVISTSPGAEAQVIGYAITATKIQLEFDSVAVAGSANFIEDEFTPTLGQITFILSQAPTDLDSLAFLVNGVHYDDTVDFTVSGTTVTWLNTPFSLDTTDKVHARYV